MCLRPVLRPRRARPARPLRQVGTAPRASDYGGSPREVISGLNGRALALAVYASQGGSLHHHARLTSSRWPDSTGRDCIPAGFQRKVSKWFSPSRPPFLSFLGAADVPDCAIAHTDCARPIAQPRQELAQFGVVPSPQDSPRLLEFGSRKYPSISLLGYVTNAVRELAPATERSGPPELVISWMVEPL